MNGTMINYYFHCKRQCFMFAHRLNLEDNSEIVKIGKAIHEDRSRNSENTEIKIENIALDKINSKYVTEVKKSDADVEASKWQLLYYLKILKDKGIERKGKLEFIEKNKTDKKIVFVELDEDTERELEKHILEIQKLLETDELPKVINKASCKKCAYYEYCYI
ncbi:CRISPR-associated protein cas4 [Fusobacterium animalis F0419]|uniref:CRISPR-associated exonuclease Cas4 n=1 Tax=Fusobacterium animalis F0419 TaxID=999414 RepID=H1HG12_9FUSO|nr:CRISPR-associated protein Cas4 [Fusobacterium animalis]EHO77290.1 CRISPR-associated protein cas4 [Fusobacterium animalis F0419]